MEFRSRDGRFGLKLDEKLVQRIFAFCEASGGCEIGGILAGFYTPQHDCAVVTTVTGPPIDSRRGKTWFQRGTRGLQRLLRHLWSQDQRYYLGEWHFHPGAAPEPSVTDIGQLTQIAHSSIYQCPEPVLVIIGGTISGE